MPGVDSRAYNRVREANFNLDGLLGRLVTLDFLFMHVGALPLGKESCDYTGSSAPELPAMILKEGSK